MALDDINVLSTLRQALGYHNARQRVIAENVANVNTPGFTPGEISQSQFERVLDGQAGSAPGGLRVTDPRHFTGGATAGSAAAYRTEARPDSETTVNGNSVVIEEQMVRANENRMKFETALSLYQKSLNMVRTAARPAGQ
ncbi:MAG: flagellar basal body rod protein FlgB [Oceanicaulis sp.]